MRFTLIPALLLGAVSFQAVPALAQGAPAAMSQQERMKACNTEAGAKNLAGPARQDFMKTCLSGQVTAAPAAPAATSQQERMKACNAEAGTRNLAGQPRQDFMKTCLSGVAVPAAAGAAKPPATPTAATGPRLDLNSAKLDELDKLPEIGAARAQAIVKGRPYKSVDELASRKIIPANAFEAIKDKVGVK